MTHSLDDWDLLSIYLKVNNKTKNIFSDSYLKPIIQNSLCHKNGWPQLIVVKTLKRENIKSKWRKMLSVTEIIYKNTEKCTKLTSNYTQHKKIHCTRDYSKHLCLPPFLHIILSLFWLVTLKAPLLERL